MFPSFVLKESALSMTSCHIISNCAYLGAKDIKTFGQTCGQSRDSLFLCLFDSDSRPLQDDMMIIKMVVLVIFNDDANEEEGCVTTHGICYLCCKVPQW